MVTLIEIVFWMINNFLKETRNIKISKKSEDNEKKISDSEQKTSSEIVVLKRKPATSCNKLYLYQIKPHLRLDYGRVLQVS